MKGKSGAQEAMTNPAEKNASRVASRAGAVAEKLATIRPIFNQNEVSRKVDKQRLSEAPRSNILGA
jgi:hypothetical protein